ncbi:MAG: ATP-binding cassette domain-containing protein, partial [Rhodospirillaceae bacterium]|nr:ATP-binding cassette domain-containing protein [Rhodospirillaceae bacterium]
PRRISALEIEVQNTTTHDDRREKGTEIALELANINANRLLLYLEMIETLGMGEEADRRTKGFSKGQTLKVALARALVHKPHNVMLDEPTNGLDVDSSRAVRNMVHAIRDEGRCVLFSSHIMSEVQNLCDRIIVMGHGSVVAEGTADELASMTGQADLEEIFVAIAKEESEMRKKNQLDALKEEIDAE